jgi:hypothetical protein
MSFDWKRLSGLDRAIVISAAVAFIAAFLPWYGATVGPFSASVSGWSAGFSAWAGSLLLVAAGVILVVHRSGASLQLGSVGPSLLVATTASLGLFLVVIRWISFPRYHGADVGARYGIYVALIVGIVEVIAAVKQMRDSAEPMPWGQGATDQPAEPAAPEPEPAAEPASSAPAADPEPATPEPAADPEPPETPAAPQE